MSQAAGEKVPMVFFPRFTTFVGNTTFSTTPIDMLGFSGFSVTAFRGKMTGTSPSISFEIQQSADLEDWHDLETAWNVPESTSETRVIIPSRRYVRMAVILGGSDPSVTCFAVGYADRTVT